MVFDGQGPNGSITWFLGFIALLLPFLGALLAGPVMAFHANREARHNAFAREHTRRAANWGITYTLLTIAFFVVHFGVLAWAANQGIVMRGFAPLGYVAVLWFLVSAFHLGICMVGGMRARRGEEFGWWAAIPVFK